MQGFLLFASDLQCPGSGRHLDISYPVQQFKRTVMDSESYDEINNSVRIIHTRK